MSWEILEVVSKEQVARLKELGYVIVHSQATESMKKAAHRRKFSENYGVNDVWNRMIAESIRIQCNE